jgi:hypothetical protein
LHPTQCPIIHPYVMMRETAQMGGRDIRKLGIR